MMEIEYARKHGIPVFVYDGAHYTELGNEETAS